MILTALGLFSGGFACRGGSFVCCGGQILYTLVVIYSTVGLVFSRASSFNLQGYIERTSILLENYYFISLHYISFHFITLHYITLHYITFHYITLHYITLHYITLHYITLHYITLHYITLHYITFHFISFYFILFLSSVKKARSHETKALLRSEYNFRPRTKISKKPLSISKRKKKIN